VARGDLSRKITVDVRGGNSRAEGQPSTRWWTSSIPLPEVTRVAREVGTEGSSVARPRCPASPALEGLTDNVNFMASN